MAESRNESNKRAGGSKVPVRRQKGELGAANTKRQKTRRNAASSNQKYARNRNSAGTIHENSRNSAGYDSDRDELYRERVRSSTKHVYSLRRIEKRRRFFRTLAIGAVVLLVIAAAFFIAFEVFPVYETARMEIGTQATVEDFLRFPIKDASFTENSEDYDCNVPGTYHLEIKAGMFAHPCELTVSDTRAPVIQVKDLIIGKEESCEAGDFIESVEDASETTVEFLNAPDLSLIGEEQTVTVKVTDQYKNSTEENAKLQIMPFHYRVLVEAGGSAPSITAFTETEENEQNRFLTDVSSLDYSVVGDQEIQLLYQGTEYPGQIRVVDTQPPVFHMAENFSSFLGDSIRYKEHVSVTDNSGTYDLQVDTSNVNQSALGTYDVTYTAADPSGNQSSVTLQITIEEKTVEEEALFARIDAILSEIITDDMTPRDKAYAVYSYIVSHVTWLNESPKGDYVMAAMQGLDWGQGDCYTFFSLSKVMLTRAGVKNRDIEKLPDGNDMHYWNLVDVEDGHGWYHFDTTPFEIPVVIFLLTDAELMQYNYYGQYNYDRTVYTDIP